MYCERKACSKRADGVIVMRNDITINQPASFAGDLRNMVCQCYRIIHAEIPRTTLGLFSVHGDIG